MRPNTPKRSTRAARSRRATALRRSSPLDRLPQPTSSAPEPSSSGLWSACGSARAGAGADDAALDTRAVADQLGLASLGAVGGVAVRLVRIVAFALIGTIVAAACAATVVDAPVVGDPV